MPKQALFMAGMLIALLTAVGGAAWWWRSTPAAEGFSGVLPVPPLPPRIDEGADYQKCLAMLADDPAGANAFADAWEATGGGDGAAHCHALAQIALGNAETGAAMMEHLARQSRAPDAMRATIFDQAEHAWLIAGNPGRGYGAATMAVTLDPDDADLLIDHSVVAATLGRYGEAIEDLDRALRIDPRRTDALVFRAAAAREEGHLRRAQDDIDRALAQDPEDADALLERGILRQRRGDTRGARADWQRAMELDPDSATGDLAQQNLALLEAGPERQ